MRVVVVGKVAYVAVKKVHIGVGVGDAVGFWETNRAGLGWAWYFV